MKSKSKSKPKPKLRPKLRPRSIAAQEALFDAIRDGQDRVALRLFKAGVPINRTDPEGFCALRLAVVCNRARLVEQMLERGAKPNLERRRPGSGSPLSVASGMGKVGIVKSLIAAGAHLLPKGIEGWAMPLALAAYHGHANVVRVLLDEGVPVDYAGDDGRTALFWAALEGRSKAHVKTVELLLARGADKNCVDAKGFSPLGIAERRHNDGVIAILRRHGARSISPAPEPIGVDANELKAEERG